MKSGLQSLFAPAQTLLSSHEEMIAASKLDDGTLMNIEGKEYLVVPFKEENKQVTCCVFENVGKFGKSWRAVKGQRVIMELA